jgi:hypothetical protein
MKGSEMVDTRVEGYLINLSLTYEEVGDNVFLINDEEKGLGHVIVFAEDSLVTIRAKVMELPSNKKEEFLEELLRLNIDLVHGAYALEDNNVIIIDTLELGSMDLEEFQASLDAIGLALAQHYPRLSQFRDGA